MFIFSPSTGILAFVAFNAQILFLCSFINSFYKIYPLRPLSVVTRVTGVRIVELDLPALP